MTSPEFLSPTPAIGRTVEPGITRRALLAASPAILAISTAPSLARAYSQTANAEPVTDQIERLSGDLSDAMGRYLNGDWKITVAADRDISLQPRRLPAHGTVSNVTRAIATHKQAAKAFDDAIDREWEIEESLEANPLYDPTPKVRYGFMLAGRNADGTDQKKPLYAYSLKELDTLEQQEVHLEGLYWSGRRIPAVKARYAELKRSLANQERRKRYHERKAGLPAAQRACSAASRNAELAAAAVLLAIPANSAEASAKRGYMRGKSCFTPDWWDAETLMVAIRANVGEVA